MSPVPIRTPSRTRPPKRALSRHPGYSAGMFPVPVLRKALMAWTASNAWPHWTRAVERAVSGKPKHALVQVRMPTVAGARIVGEMLERRARGLV